MWRGTYGSKSDKGMPAILNFRKMSCEMIMGQLGGLCCKWTSRVPFSLFCK